MKTKPIPSKELLHKLDYSYSLCESAAKSSNFYAGISLSNRNERQALFAVYAWFRALDEIVDNNSLSIPEKTKQLKEFTFKTNNVLRVQDFTEYSSFWLAFRHTIEIYAIPQTYFDNMIRGQEKDLTVFDYKTFAELYEYCKQIASMVGLVCIQIWGYQGASETRQMAEWCGIAFQLTNILRDISQDANLNHVYLPAEYFGIPELNVSKLRRLPKDEILNGVQKLIEKANIYYKNSLNLYKRINAPGRLPFLVMFYYYHAIFEKIRKNPAIIFSGQRIKLNPLEKMLMITTAFVNHKILHRI